MNRFEHPLKLRMLSSSPLSEMDQNSEKDNYTLAIVDNGKLLYGARASLEKPTSQKKTMTGGARMPRLTSRRGIFYSPQSPVECCSMGLAS